MLAASQDIDNFIERQRSKLNNQTNRQQVNRPPPPQPSLPPNRTEDRLDYKVARILDEPPPRIQSQQPYYPSPPSPPSFTNNSMSEQQDNFHPGHHQQQQRRLSNDNQDKNPSTFFNKFGTYDDKRSQLKDDLKREYNEYLQSQKRVPKSKSTSQLPTPRGNNTNKRVQFQQPNGKVVAPWEKNDNKTQRNVQSMNDLSSSTTTATTEYSTNRSRPQISQNHDGQYIQEREEYISELHSQIRELELRKRQLEMESNKLSAGGSSNVTRAHYNEDLNALNSLLAERLDQRNAVDHELAHILNRPPVSASPTRASTGGMPNHNMSMGHSNQVSSQQYPPQNGRQTQPYRNDQRSKPNDDNGFQIGRDIDKDAEQASKKRYQQELQAQMREAQMRKAQAKQDKDEYERKLDADVQRYNYFGRGGGGGAPMRDKEGNVVANLADVRNPPPPQQQQQQQYQQPHQQQYQQPQQQHQQQQHFAPNDKVYSLGNGTSAITDSPFYNGEQGQQYPSNTDRPGSPNHTRGAVSNGLFGTAKTEAQVLREDKYKQELKQQIAENRQRAAEEVARRRAEEERELAKHAEWQQQMDRQVAEDASRKQEREAQERVNQQQLHEELERQKKQEEIASKRKPKRQEKPPTPKRNDDEGNDNAHGQNDYDDQQQQQQAEPAYRSSSPPIPALKNKGKKPKSNVKNVKRGSFDDVNQQQSPPPLPPLYSNDDFIQLPPADDTDSQGRQTYRKPPTPRQPDVSSARKKPPQTYRSRPRADSNSNMPMRTNSTTSLRSDGSDSEVLNRLEHLKRQLKDKEARLQEHVNIHQTTASNNEQQSKTTYQPPSQPRKQSPGFLLNATRVHHRDSPTTNDKMRHMLQTDDDMEFKPSYFRDDAILMGGAGGNNRHINGEYYPSSKRIDSANGMFATNTEKEANRRRYGLDQSGFYDHEDPTTMANYELNRIAEQNAQRLKKLRDLENDDASLLDSNEVLERFQQKQRLRRGSQTTLQDDAWLK